MCEAVEPLPARDIAEYCRDVAGQLAVLAAEAGLAAVAAAFETARAAANEAVQRNADPGDAA